METETVFKYADLNDRAKERARDWYREGVSQDWEPNYEDLEQCLACLGFEVHSEDYRAMNGKTLQRPAISYSIGYVQGDYASFSASWYAEKIDGARLAEYAPLDERLRTACAQLTAIMLAHPQASAIVKMNNTNRSSAHSIEGGNDDINDPNMSFEEELHHVVNDLADWMYWQMRNELDYQNSDEACEEGIEANEYDFDEDGRRV